MSKQSSSYQLLDENIQRWIWKQGWTSLKDIQEKAIPIILNRNCDVIINAATAGGKTEAVFLPILTYIIKNKKDYGYQVLYISPLKSLINNQCQRLIDIVKDLCIDVTPWHGDISQSIKTNSLKNPNGILIITPESLESFLINRNFLVKKVFNNLDYIVIDELHSFIGKERGKQLQSLISRIEHIVGKTVFRIAMSATFSDYNVVKSFLRNNNLVPCEIPSHADNNHETKLIIKEYINDKESKHFEEISFELYNRLRGSNNLVFANSRNDAEYYALNLSEISEKNGVVNEFRVHHGSLSKSEREIIEHELFDGKYPITAFCTSTMELGVDIGKVKSIVQINTANSVSSLRQRLGRSGRRNEPSILRVYSIDDKQGIMGDIKANLVQNIAVVELLKEHKYESPKINSYHFSTLVQQVVSMIAQFGGFYPKEAWQLLCEKGAFNNVTISLFLELLKSLGKNNIISQLENGQIIIGKKGEELLRESDFYTAFIANDEIDVINKFTSKRIGSIQFFPEVSSQIILSGKRWLVENVDKNLNNIYVRHVKSGGDIFYFSEQPEVDKIIVQKMKYIYLSDELYPYLDSKTLCIEHLISARKFVLINFVNNVFVEYGKEKLMFSWMGSLINRTIKMIIEFRLHKKCNYNHLFIENVTKEDIKLVVSREKPTKEQLTQIISRDTKEKQKYDYLLSEHLLDLEYANTYLDIDNAWNFICDILNKDIS